MLSADSSIRVSANATYQTPWLAELTGNSRMNIKVFFAIIAVAVIGSYQKTTAVLKSVQLVSIQMLLNMQVFLQKRAIILSMIISGALAGLGGAVEGLGTFKTSTFGSSLAIGFGMAVSLPASNSPVRFYLQPSFQCSSK